tara:strand:- start:360 stop:710 length:351 start_codon:yes stop_codon:yes gene_type:complete
MIPYNRAPWAGNNRYTKQITFCFLLDSFVYVVGPQAEVLDFVKVEGVWQSPRDIERYIDKHGHSSYNPETDEYPLSTSMLDLIKQSMLAQNLQPLIQMPTDVSNNSKSDVQPSQQK